MRRNYQTMNDYKQRILDAYGRALTAELGSGGLHKKLLSELELILENVPLDRPANKDRPSAQQPIDYNALRITEKSLGRKRVVNRIRHAFQAGRITTYEDLFTKYTEKQTANGFNLGLQEYIRIYFRNIGSRSAEVLMRHLELAGLEIHQ